MKYINQQILNSKTGNLILIVFSLILAGNLQSCITTQPIAYFQSSDSLKYKQLAKLLPKVTRIRTNDILAITVGSLNQESNAIMNFANINALTTTSFPGSQGGSVQRSQPLGYLVDSLGNVEIPFVGKLKLTGMTLDEAGNAVRTQVEKSLKEPAINVRYLNHKFSVLGEVNHSATFNLLDDNTTLPEALAMAGDLSIYANRTNVTIIRENNGIREMAKINLLTQEIFDSPYYFMQNGDLIYVEPLKSKATFNDQKVQLAPLYTGVATTVLVFLSLLLNVFK